VVGRGGRLGVERPAPGCQREIDRAPQRVDVAAAQRARVEVRVEVFNLFNRANFSNPTLVAFAGAAAGEAPLASFGRIRSTVTSSRQTQLGVRVTF
jgi:hypothetical protein